MAPAVLVLRPQPGADETVAALDAAGIPALALPVLERRPLAETAAMRASIQALAEYSAVIFVSPAAVELGMAWVDRYWPQYPAATSWIAVGERTRTALERWGLKVAAPESDERSEGLLALPELTHVSHEKILLMRGLGGRDLLAETLRERGAQVDILELYERQPVSVTLPAAEDVAGAVVSSVAVLESLLASGGRSLLDRPLVVPSERVAAAARDVGFTQVLEADGAGPAATVSALRHLVPGGTR
ncbi:MAG: uroporphyrinogen-III synthase [Gammaproteobacteria bacterium]|nr:MAG: uroporphyrinogen-III synthase [Gammaproteobacteria bacterium]